MYQEQANDLRSVMNQALEPARQYKRKKGAVQWKPKKARFKLKVWFKDGNERVFFSYDNRTSKEGERRVDEWIGLRALIRLVTTYEGKFKTIMIFTTSEEIPWTKTSDYCIEIAKYSEHRMMSAKNVGFDKGMLKLKDL